jgi:hypothetical protein
LAGYCRLIRSHLCTRPIQNKRSSQSKLKAAAQPWSQQVTKAELAIYASQNGYYALVIKGDGSFTFAYNKTVELQKNGTAGVYFAESKDWGKDYLE